MTERERLLRAIEADPDDDTVRLVYADWCEENGDEARARFIRLQCGPAGHEAEADSLLAEHRAAWTAGLPKWARGEQFKRGFPDIWQLTGRSFLNDAAAIRAATPLDALMLTELRGRQKVDVFASPQLAGVRQLMIGASQLNDAGIEALASSEHLRRLRGLSAPCAPTEAPNASNRLTDSACLALARSKSLPALVSLSLVGQRKITAAGVRALTESAALRGLAELDFSSTEGGPATGALFRSPGFRMPALRELRLNACKLGDAGVAALAAAPGLSNLRTLELKHNRIGDEGAAALAASPHLTGLEELDLWSNCLGNAGVTAIAGSRHLSGLKRLDVGQTGRVTDAGVLALLAGGRRWEALSLDGVGVSPRVMRLAADQTTG